MKETENYSSDKIEPGHTLYQIKHINQRLNSLLFSLVILLLISGLVITKHYIHNYVKSAKVNLPEARTIVIGDSHTKCAINPKYLNETLNLSQNSQNIAYSYYVIKKLIESNNKFSNVILGYAYHTTGNYYIFLHSSEMMLRYHSLVDKQFFREAQEKHGINKDLLLRHYTDNYDLPVGISNDMFEMINIKIRKTHKFPFIGEYEQDSTAKLKLPLTIVNTLPTDQASLKTRRRNIHFLKETLEKHYYSNSDLSQSEFLTDYLDKTAQLCAENHITLYLVNTPVHSEYFKRIPKKVIDDVDNYALKMESKYHIKWLNYSQLSFDDKYYADYDHLTFEGAELFSKKLAVDLEEYNERKSNVDYKNHFIVTGTTK